MPREAKVIDGLTALDPPLARSVLTVGNFDGVHLAHQKLLHTAAELAAQSRALVVVLTFEPHPLTVVAPEKAPPRLTPLADKVECLAAGGAEVIVVARSEPSLLSLEAERFVEEVLVRQFRPSHVVEGPSFGFGRGRKGGPELLTALAPKYGYEFHVVDPVTMDLRDGRRAMVSSSLIRELLRDGRVEEAADCLTRPYTLVGSVIPGHALGRRIGFPTANLGPVDQVVPGDGVYAGTACVGEQSYACAINVGFAPTFDVKQPRVEAHLLDFCADLYGQVIRLRFLRRLRSQEKFVSPAALADQLQEDVETVRRLSTPSPAAALS